MYLTQYQRDWFKRWPNHCDACRGSGIADEYIEMHGFTYGPGERITEPCEALDADQCHRCGEHALDEQNRCAECGWTGAGLDDVGPPDEPDFDPPDEPDYDAFPEPSHYY